MFIDFTKYSFPIKDIIFYDDDEENYYSSIILKINETTDIILTAQAECCSNSFIKKFENYDFNILINKTIININQIKFPDNYEYKEDDLSYITFNDCITPHLYEIKFKETNETFKMLLINYSNGYYDGWLDIDIKEL